MKTSIIMPCQILDQDLLQLSQNAIDTLRGFGELVIIDNNSEIGSGYLRSEADIYVLNKKNVGYPASVNQGLALAHGECLAIANNDIRVSPNWWDVAQEIFKEDTKVGSVHYKMISYDRPFSFGIQTWKEGRERWCTSSFFVIRKEAMLSYDENYGLGGYDDWDIWHRIRHINGWKTAYTDKACYQHLHSSTQKRRDFTERDESDRKSKQYFKSKFGKYPEEIWNEKYPDQMKEDYYLFFGDV